MSSTHIRVGGRLFYVKVAALQNSNKYHCMFHEKYEWLGRSWGFRPVNKNGATKERDEVYDWFKSMVEDNLPQDESGDEVLDSVVEQLTDEYDRVERA